MTSLGKVEGKAKTSASGPTNQTGKSQVSNQDAVQSSSVGKPIGKVQTKTTEDKSKPPDSKFNVDQFIWWRRPGEESPEQYQIVEVIEAGTSGGRRLRLGSAGKDTEIGEDDEGIMDKEDDPYHT